MAPILTLVAIAIALAGAVVQNAGEANWNWTVSAIALAGFFHYLLNRTSTLRTLNRVAASLLAAFLFLVLLQITPLPFSLVAVLSPAKAALVRATEPVLGPAPSWTTLSIVPLQTLQYCVNLGVYVLTFLVLREISLRFNEQERPWFATVPLIVIAAAEGALGFYQAYAEGGEGLARGTYGNRDHYAGFLELVLPFAVLYPVAILQRDRQRHASPAGPALKACAILAMGAVILIGIIHSLSRGAFLATFASLFLCGALMLGFRNTRIDPPLKITWFRRALPIALVAFVTLLGFIFLPTDPLIGRFADLAQTEDISADTRAQIWRESAGLVRDYFWFGCGLGGYESAFYRYKTVGPMFTVDYAHNDYLQVLAEMGIFGFLNGVLILLGVFHSAARKMVYAYSPDERCLAVACIASLTAILLHSFVDFNMYRQANALTVAWIAGIAATRLSARKRTRISSSPPRSEALHTPPLQPQ